MKKKETVAQLLSTQQYQFSTGAVEAVDNTLPPSYSYPYKSIKKKKCKITQGEKEALWQEKYKDGYKVTDLNFNYSHLQEVLNWKNSTIIKCSFSHDSQFKNTKLIGATFIETTFAGLKIDESDLSASVFKDSIFLKTNLSNVRANNASFELSKFFYSTMVKCSFENVSFAFTVIENSDLRLSKFINCDFSDTLITRVNFNGSDLTKTKFSGATIINCTFKGAVITNSNIKTTQFTDLEALQALSYAIDNTSPPPLQDIGGLPMEIPIFPAELNVIGAVTETIE